MQIRKVCLLGDFGVGKTSLVRRFVTQQFSEKYHTSIGVKVDTKQLTLDELGPVKMVIWDIAGAKSLDTLYQRYLKGAAGYLLVADGTRMHTLDNALSLRRQLESQLGYLPWVGLLNKNDLTADWEVPPDRIAALSAGGALWRHSSAKTGEAVEPAFKELAYRMLA